VTPEERTRQEIEKHREADDLHALLSDADPEERLLLAIGNIRRLVAERERLRDLMQKWLDDTDEADEDDPGIHDFYVRVGARWGQGNYYRKFTEALDATKGWRRG
jgi:hypothetical protein